MQIKNLLVFGFAAFIAADCDENDDNSNDCSTSAVANSTTTTDVNGAVITNLATSTDIDRSTSLVPVRTEDVDTSTDVDVETSRNTLSATTDVGTTPTNTLVQVATTTDVNLESGYAYTTNDDGSTIATYTGTDTNAPPTTSIAASATGDANDDNDDDGDDNTSDSFAMATAVPYLGAAAMAGAAFFV